jgi:two-component system, LuxR family, response regulator FixJ
MSEQEMVHIIDDDDAIRDSLQFLLSTASLEVAAHESAADFLEGLAQSGADCILTDVRMPGMSGIELLRHLKRQGNEVPIIVMTGHGDVALAVEAMKAGAFDFLEKPFSDDQVLNAVRAAIDDWRGAQDQDRRRRELKAAVEALSARERQVLDGLIEGHPNKTIAYDLGISPRTVEIYRANLMTKLGASSLSDVIRIAFIVRGGEYRSRS